MKPATKCALLSSSLLLTGCVAFAASNYANCWVYYGKFTRSGKGFAEIDRASVSLYIPQEQAELTSTDARQLAKELLAGAAMVDSINAQYDKWLKETK